MKRNLTLKLVIMSLLAFSSVILSYIYGYYYAKQGFLKTEINRLK